MPTRTAAAMSPWSDVEIGTAWVIVGQVSPMIEIA